MAVKVIRGFESHPRRPPLNQAETAWLRGGLPDLRYGDGPPNVRRCLSRHMTTVRRQMSVPEAIGVVVALMATGVIMGAADSTSVDVVGWLVAGALVTYGVVYRRRSTTPPPDGFTLATKCLGVAAAAAVVELLFFDHGDIIWTVVLVMMLVTFAVAFVGDWRRMHRHS